VRYLLSVLVFALFLSGCSATSLSLTDRLSGSTVMSAQGAAAGDSSVQEPAKPARPTARPPAPDVESVQASYQETSHMDRF
jgi:hypothetical protein